MAKSKTSEQARGIYPARADAIRIVPLYHAGAAGQPTVDAAAVPAAPPRLTYRNGPLLTTVEVFTVFWGAAWQQAQAMLVTEINQFFDFILTSPLITQLAEYSVPGKKFGLGNRLGTITITTPAPLHSVSDTALQHMLQQEISTNAAFPHPTPNTLLRVPIARCAGRARGSRFLPGVLWLSQRHLRRDFLRRCAVPWMQRVRRWARDAGRANDDQLA